MTINRWARLWTGVSAIALLSMTAACDPGDQTPTEKAAGQNSQTAPDTGIADIANTAPLADGEGEGGGEFGIDPERALNDPVVYLTALEVINAHYLAGRAVYSAGRIEEAAEMFAHPIAEVYFELEPALAANGAPLFIELMENATDLALDRVPEAEILPAIDAVIDAVQTATQYAPKSARSQAAIEGAVLADLIERAALQYQLVVVGETAGAYIDGVGYYQAANARAQSHLAALRETAPRLAEAVNTALTMLAAAYPAITIPEPATADPSALLAASSRVSLRLSGL